jgi:hypothetical protein
MMETKPIRATLIFEVIGRPPEHLTETLKEIVSKVDAEKGASVKSKKLNEPVLMKDSKDFYTCFAEVEVEVEEIINLAFIIFRYMPAHVEIASPESIALSNNGWSEILGELVRRLHGYDEVTRIVQTEKTILERKLKDLMDKSNENKS